MRPPLWAYRVKDSLMRPVCLLRGCNYDTPVFMSGCLYFCTRCHREMLGRTFDDIEPLTDEQREQLEYFDNIYGER